MVCCLCARVFVALWVHHAIAVLCCGSTCPLSGVCLPATHKPTLPTCAAIDHSCRLDAVDFKPQYTHAQLQKLLHNHHHHNTRSTRRAPPALSSFERHMQIASAAAAALRLQRRSSKRLSLPNGHAGLEQQQPGEQQHLGLLGGSSSPAKQPRRIKPEAVLPVAQQPQQEVQRPPKRQRPEAERQRPEAEQQLLVSEQQQQPADADAAGQQLVKRRKHKDGGSKQRVDQLQQQQQQSPKQPPAPAQQQQQPQPEPRQPQQAHKAGAFATPTKQQQAAAGGRSVGPTVTGAAALELVMSASRSAGGSRGGLGAPSWEGGDSDAAAQAAALRRAAAQQAKRKERDEWDVEYDRGKTKKVRSKQGAAGDDGEGGEDGCNRFQQAWQQQLPQKARQEAWKGMSSGEGGQQRRAGGGGRGGRHRGGGGGRGGGRGRGFGGGGGGRGGRGRGGGGFGGRGGGGGRGRGGGRRGR